MELHLDLIRQLAESRTPAATAFFQLFTLVGELEGYVVLVSILHVTFDKRLAFRLAVLTLLTMSLNHVLKTLIAIPRPFVAEGTFAERWAVSPAKAEELVAEYSTPSGHAMAGSCFYTYLGVSVSSRAARVVAGVTLILVGLSRPYLGVHYLEDVLLGWAIGIPIALAAARAGGAVGRAWSRLRVDSRVLLVVGAAGALWAITGPQYDSALHGRPQPFVSYLGLLFGLVIAFPLEARWVAFDPRSSTVLHKLLRVLLSLALTGSTLLVLDAAFDPIAEDGSALGDLLRYVRYAAAGAVAALLAPYLFVRLGLAGASEARRGVG